MNEVLLDKIMSCRSLPTLPGVAMRLLELIREPDVEFRDLAAVISNDPALAGKILKTVNSSFYGLSKTVSTVTQAMLILGLQSVRTLALGFTLVGSLRCRDHAGFDPVQYWRRSLYAGVSAKALAEKMGVIQIEEAFLAALLRDIGQLAMHAAIPEEYAEVRRGADGEDALVAAERQRLDLTHAEVGYELARRWSLPPVLAEPVRWHNQPERIDPELRGVADAIMVAGLFAEVFIQPDTKTTLAVARRAAIEVLGLSRLVVDQLLTELDGRVRQTAELFELKIDDGRRYADILSQAKDALVELSLASQQEAIKLRGRNAELQQSAAVDPLTGLANRTSLQQQLAERLDQARQSGRPVFLVFIDADHFKQVNDTFGHDAGDAVLRRLAEAIRDACGPRGLSGRFGGEEFVCVPDEPDLRSAARWADTLRQTVAAEPVEYQGQVVPFTISLGVAAVDADAGPASAEQLLRLADRALYSAKQAGRNTVRIAAPATASR